MDNIKNVNYQNEALFGCEEDGQEGLIGITNRLLKATNVKDYPEVILKAITGAGKTVIMAKYINSILEQEDRKSIVFVWLSVGTGGLQFQSAEKIRPLLSKKVTKIICPESEKDFNQNEFKDGNLLILNWEKINNTKNDKLVSNLMIGEKHNLKKAIENTNKDIKFIILIDEFHKNYRTDAYNLLMDVFKPSVIIGMTATPTKEQLANKKFEHNIPTAKVREAEMIKKGIIFNENFSSINLNEENHNGLTEEVLTLALNKRTELDNLYTKESSNVTPLCLIQVPNNNKEYLDTVINFLSNYEENGKKFIEDEDFTCWISNKPKNESLIKNINNNTVKCLIFKQAIATGWDCPRAHILVKFRPLKSTIDAFDLQTIGRVLRTAERKYYSDDKLNYAYIYAPEEKFNFSKEVEAALGNPEIKNQSITYESDIELIESILECENLQEKELKPSRIEEILIDTLKEKYNANTSNNNSEKIHIFDAKIDTNDSLLDDNLNISTHDNVIVYNSVQLSRKFNVLLNSLKKSFISYNSLRSILFDFFDDKVESNLSEENKIIEIIKKCVSHEDTLKKVMSDVSTKVHQETERKKGTNSKFNFRRHPKYSVDKVTNNYKKCIYEPCINDNFSDPEVIFIQELENNPNVKWWYKNLDKGKDALSIVYTESIITVKGKAVKTLAPTYPDFIVFFEHDNKKSLGIYEVKDANKVEEINDRKDSAIKTYIASLNKKNKNNKDIDYIYGGIVKIKNSNSVNSQGSLIGEIDNIDDYVELKVELKSALSEA